MGSSSKSLVVRFLISWIAVTFVSYLFGKDLKIFMTFSTLMYIFLKA